MRKLKMIAVLSLTMLMLFGCTNVLIGDPIGTKEVIVNNNHASAEVGITAQSGLVKIENPTYVDGDTVKGLIDGQQKTVRLLLIDTPETKHPTKGVQPFGPEASAFTKDFVEKNKNNLYIEYDVEEKDKYDRVLGYIWNDKVMLNSELIKNGLARVGYVYKSKKHLSSLQEVETVAKKNGLGIWSLSGYVTDKGYSESYTTKKKLSSTEKTPATKPTLATNKSAQNSSIPDYNNDGVCNDVKGNQGSSGWIYHIPGGSSYENTKPEELFCTTQEAEDAGYRAAGR